VIKKAVKEALKEFFSSEEGQQLIGQIVYSAVRAEMTRTLVIKDGKSRPGEEPHVREEQVHILEFLARYLPDIEGRMLGMQADVASARNKAISAGQMFSLIQDAVQNNKRKSLEQIKEEHESFLEGGHNNELIS